MMHLTGNNWCFNKTRLAINKMTVGIDCPGGRRGEVVNGKTYSVWMFDVHDAVPLSLHFEDRLPL